MKGFVNEKKKCCAEYVFIKLKKCVSTIWGNREETAEKTVGT